MQVVRGSDVMHALIIVQDLILRVTVMPNRLMLLIEFSRLAAIFLVSVWLCA